MLFELRTTIPEVSLPWRTVRDLLLSGKVRDARFQSEELRRSIAVVSANDFLLQVELARACGRHKRSLAWARLAYRYHPDDLLTCLHYARSLLIRQMHGKGIALLESLEGTWGQTHRVEWSCMLADLLGDAGFETSSLEILQSLEQDPVANTDPLSLYHRSCAYEGLRRWPEAISLAEQCVELAPGWLRARGYLVHCLLTQGRLEEARHHLAKGASLGHEDATFDSTAAMFTFSEGRYDLAQPMLEGILAKWPDSDSVAWARRTLCLLLVESGRCQEARTLQVSSGSNLAFPPITETAAASRHRFIPLPFIAQNRNQCVPTCVAMAAHPQGDSFDPAQLFLEMEGRDGTALWRMREWVESHGYRLVPVPLNATVIREALDKTGIPLIGVIEGAFNSHVEILCGFHDSLDVFYVRDPSHWAPSAVPSAMALSRYELHGAVYGLIKVSSERALTLLQSMASDEGGALLDLAAAVFHGDRISAEAAAARIPDDHPTALLRDLSGVRVTLSPLTFRSRMEALGRRTEANVIARFRALMQLGWHADTLESLDEVVRSQSHTIGRKGLLVLSLLKARTSGNWDLALRIVDRLLLFGNGVEAYWSHRSDILAESGDLEGSLHSLRRAIELAPRTVGYREKLLQRTSDQLSWQEYLDHFSLLQEEDPHDRRLLWGLAQALQDGPDGLHYERIAFELLDWFPRDPECYWALTNWYGHQNRSDLVAQILRRGEDLLGEEINPTPSLDKPPLPESPPDVSPPPPGTNLTSEDWLRLLWSEPSRQSEALAALLKEDQTGALEWQARAQLIAFRLLHPLLPGKNGPIPQVSEILPEELPGTPHWFLTTLTSILTGQKVTLPPATAVLVLQWCDRLLPTYQGFVGLWFNRVLLHEASGHMEEALRELESLLQRYPAHSSALYRMGVVKYRQQDLASAADFFRRALEVNPGLPGALQQLRDVSDALADLSTLGDCLVRLVKKFPYDFDHLRTLVLHLSEHYGTTDAFARIEESQARFPAPLIDTLRARCHFLNDDLSAAKALVAKIDARAGDDTLREQVLQIRMSLATREDDTSEILRICELGLEFWPDSTRLLEIKAQYSPPETALPQLETLLLSGEPTARTVRQYLSLIRDTPHHAARLLIDRADQERTPLLLDLFATVLGRPDYLSSLEPFLTWAWSRFPAHLETGSRLALHYNISRQSIKAVALARDLNRREPDNPVFEHLLGRCLIDTDAKEAAKHLKRACAKNRSAPYLFDLARCQQILGNQEEARRIHREVLQKNPLESASLTNLYLLGEPANSLWSHVNPILKNLRGDEDEYFLVVAVHLARAQNGMVTPEWIDLAVSRLTVLQTHPGFRDEVSRLRRSVGAWSSARPDDRERIPAAFQPSWWIRWKGRLGWPGRKWIPR